MSRETVRMVRLGIRPEDVVTQHLRFRVDPFAEERAKYEARIAELEADLAIANKALRMLMRPLPGPLPEERPPWEFEDGIGFWMESEE